MLETVSASNFEASTESTATSERATLQPLPDLLSRVAVTPGEGSTNSHLSIWEPIDPQFTKAIASYYSVSRKSVQEWFQKVKEACPWFAEADLKLPDDRYTPIAVGLMGSYRISGLPFKAWKAQIWEQNPELVAAFQSSPQSRSQQNEVLISSDSPNRVTLHLGSSLTLPPIASIVTPGNDTAYLMQTQQRLQQFEALQQQVIAQMQQQHEQAQALNAQYQEATSLSDQLLLQEFQLKGVQLGYTALQLKQQAFKATIQSVEAGTLAVPGKLPTGNEPLPSP